jgi:hypothetical protein
MQGDITRFFVNELEKAQVLNRKKISVFIFLNKTLKNMLLFIAPQLNKS